MAGALSFPAPAPAVTDPETGDVIRPARHHTDVVHMTFTSDDGTETRDASFTVDDYEKRAGSDLDAYLEKRAIPKLHAEWRPDIHETSRRVDRYVARDGEWVLDRTLETAVV